MKKHFSLILVVSLVAAPVSASVRDAAYASTADRAQVQPSVFMGASYKLALDKRARNGAHGPSLQVAGMVKDADSRFLVGNGLALSAGSKGRPAFLIGGQQIGKKDGANNLSTAATVGVVVLGLAVAAGIALAIAVDNYNDKNQE